jgi:hypothetical protein
MKFTSSLLRPLLSPARRLLQRSRSGSVLILVIALLVLLALMGTAYISTARTERYSSAQHVVNTQIDLLLQGVENLTCTTVLGKLYDPSASVPLNFRLAGNSLSQYTYRPYESPLSDLYLGSRIPEVPNPASAAPPESPQYWVTNPPMPPMWKSVSFPPVPLNFLNTNANTWQFETPTGAVVPLVQPYFNSTAVYYNQGDVVSVISGSSVKYYYANSTSNGNALLAPGFGNGNWVPIDDPKRVYEFFPTSTVAPSGQVSPALYIYNKFALGTGAFLISSNTPGQATAYTTGVGTGQPPLQAYLAADADGDGIADTGLFKLPVSVNDGVTYYAGVRVIDNNSAINASTAWTCLGDPDASGNDFYLGTARSNIGLLDSLSIYGSAGTSGPSNEINQLNRYRFGYGVGTGTADASIAKAYTTSSSGSLRADYTFLNRGDALENELIRRPQNTAYNNDSSAPYQFLGTSANLTLANHFCLEFSSSATSEIELDLPTEMLPTWGQSTPYSASNVGTSGAASGVTTTQAGTWFGDNFDFIAPTSSASPTVRPAGAYQRPYAPMRTITVGSNPISNSASGHYISRGPWVPATLYHFGDWVTASTGYRFVCIQDHTSGTAYDPATIGPYITTTVGGGSYLTPNPNNVSAELYWSFVPWTNVPNRASPNTANFGELWAAYWNVMWDHSSASGVVNAFPQPAFGFPLLYNDTTTGYVTNQAANGNIQPSSAAQNTVSIAARMFRSPIRDPGNNQSASANAPAANSASLQYLTPGQTMLLRSALAAINTISLRTASGSTTPLPATSANGLDTIVSRSITLPPDPNDPNFAGKPGYNVMLFGASKQPYITEVYVTPSTTDPFIAIELSNPYPKVMTLVDWVLGAIDRSSAGYSAGAVVGASMTNGVVMTTITIPAATVTTTGTGNTCASTVSPGKVFIWDGTALPSSFPSTASQVIQIPGLKALVGKEIVLLRHRAADPSVPTTPLSSTDPIDEYNEGTASEPVYPELVPVDQVDTEALPVAPGTSYEYRRATQGSSGAGWNFVYPGPYSFLASVNYGGGAVSTTYRSAGFQIATGQDLLIDKSFTNAYGAAVPAASFPTVPLQIANMDAAGWNQPNPSNANKFPFGGFARNGDLLQVPYIGGYRILTAPTPEITTTNEMSVGVIEMNSLPMDSAMADDEDASDDCPGLASLPTNASIPPTQLQEQIGRFCPVGTPGIPDYDFHAPVALSSSVTNYYTGWRYHWATKLFDFLSVQGAQNDYSPNADPLNYNTVATPAVPPVGVANKNASLVNAQAAGTSEDTVPLEGLVNINTAPWPVLASLPWFPPSFDFTDPIATAGHGLAPNAITPSYIAQDIVNYRNKNGPFQSIFDLMKVPSVKTLSDDMVQYSDPGPYAGDFSPFMLSGASSYRTDNVRYDFAERFLLLNRLSNLITTRSDTFTCYVIVQGWRNAGTSNASLVAQRRAAFVVDRTAATPATPMYTQTPVAQN